MSGWFGSLVDWLDDRTGLRAIRHHLLDEPLPPGTAWWFTLGSLLLFLLGIQFVTGIALALYYAPTPDHAWDSVRYVMTEVRGGGLLRGLHHWGASIIVIAALAHLVRVFVFGSYRKPREVNWILGLVLLLLILAFGLTGYLLPWDQRAYWATVVTINISRLTPVAGDLVAYLLAGGPDVGALTLTRWYAIHVLVLPPLFLGLVAAHLALMRRHGISGPVTPRPGPTQPFFPYQAARDLAVACGVGLVLVLLAWRGAPALEPPADPTSSDYIPRPEWYFLGLFQLLKYFPGRLEVIGAIVIPGLVVTALVLLPWLDRGRTRAWRDRRPVLAALVLGLAALFTLTGLGALDRPPAASTAWNVQEMAGAVLITTSDRCGRCHGADKVAAAIEPGRFSRPPDWLASHVADPIAIAPGLREAPQSNEYDTAAIIAALARFRSQAPPAIDETTARVVTTVNRECLPCHTLGGVGGREGPKLDGVGSRFTADQIERRIINPYDVKADAEMPGFDGVLSPETIHLVAQWMAAHKESE
ncbi:MAG: cytochrome b N-terminal domain-containing protein [Vicinamibacterales bacterium]